MRQSFITSLCEEAQKNDRIFLLTGDLGYKVLEPFQHQFPARFLNIGVAESNLVTVAAGLASEGFIPVVYSIATFLTMRPFEQIRNDVGVQNLNVKFVGVGGGIAYNKAGITHHSIEDIALMRLIPNMTIVCPIDPPQTAKSVKEILNYPGPGYLRLEYNPPQNLSQGLPDFKIGKAQLVHRGKDRLAIIATGTKVFLAQQTIELLTQSGINPSLISLPTINPLDEKFLKKIALQSELIITIEEHRISGGMGTAVMEYLSSLDTTLKVVRFGLSDSYSKTSGSYQYLMKLHGLEINDLASRIKKLWHKGK